MLIARVHSLNVQCLVFRRPIRFRRNTVTTRSPPSHTGGLCSLVERFHLAVIQSQSRPVVPLRGLGGASAGPAPMFLPSSLFSRPLRDAICLAPHCVLYLPPRDWACRPTAQRRAPIEPQETTTQSSPHSHSHRGNERGRGRGLSGRPSRLCSSSSALDAASSACPRASAPTCRPGRHMSCKCIMVPVTQNRSPHVLFFDQVPVSLSVRARSGSHGRHSPNPERRRRARGRAPPPRWSRAIGRRSAPGPLCLRCLHFPARVCVRVAARLHWQGAQPHSHAAPVR